jgi:HEAT repeat protein
MRARILAIASLALVFVSLLPAVGQVGDDKKKDAAAKKEPEITANTEIGGKTLPQWIKLIPSKDRSLTKTAIESIVFYGPELAQQAVPAMTAELKKHTANTPIDISVRTTIPQPMALILASAKNPDPPLVKNAVAVFKKMLADNQIIVKLRVTQAVTQLGPLARDTLPELIRIVKDPNSDCYELRLAAAAALAPVAYVDKGSPELDVVKALVYALRQDNSHQVRLLALESLNLLRVGQMPAYKTELLPVLETAAAKDADPLCKLRANLFIHNFAEKAPEKKKRRDAVAKFLNTDHDPAVRVEAAKSLGGMGDDAKDNVPQLIASLNDNDLSVVAWTMVALTQIKDKRAVGPLQALAGNPNTPQAICVIANEAIESISGLKANNPPVGQVGNNNNAGAAKKAPEKITADTEINGKTLATWIKLIPSKDRSLTKTAVESIVLYGADLAEQAVPTMIKELNKHTVNTPIDISVRTTIPQPLALILSTVKNPDPQVVKSAVAVFKKMLGDSQVIVKLRVTQAVTQLGPLARDTMPELIRIVKEPDCYELRLAAVVALAPVSYVDKAPPEIEVVRALIYAANLDHEHSHQVRLMALESLNLLRVGQVPAYKPQLLQILDSMAAKDPDPLCKLRGNLFVYTLADKAPEKKKRRDAIGKFLSTNHDPAVRVEAIKSFGSMGDDARDHVPQLIESLNDKDLSVVAWTLVALTQIKDRTAIDPLQALADNTGMPETIRATAKEAIGLISGLKANKDEPKKAGGKR